MSRFIESCGRIRAKLIAVVGSLGIAMMPLGANASPPLPSAMPIKVALCQSSNDIDSWMGVVGPALTRPLAASDVSEIQLKRNVACQQPLQVETACIAAVYNDVGGRGIACAPRTLLFLVRSAAWYTLARRPAESYTAFSLRVGGQINETAFHFADGQTPDATIEQRLSRLPHSEASPPNDEAGRTFLMALNLVFAAIFGHEDGHLYDKAPFCGIADASLVESSGLYNVLRRIQTSGELFKAADFSPEEYHADLCATRRIHKTIEWYKRQPPSNAQGDLAFARRAAADIVAFALMIHDDSPHPRPQSAAIPGYFYSPLRIVALAGELDANSKPRVCGAAAQAFVALTQANYQSYSGKGILPDDLEAALPAGVPAAWNRKAQWSAQSFACPE
jgi:hypothetical protein